MSDRVFDTRPNRKKLPARAVPAPEPIPAETTEEEILEDAPEIPAEEVNEAPALHKKARAHRHGN